MHLSNLSKTNFQVGSYFQVNFHDKSTHHSCSVGAVSFVPYCIGIHLNTYKEIFKQLRGHVAEGTNIIPRTPNPVQGRVVKHFKVVMSPAIKSETR